MLSRTPGIALAVMLAALAALAASQLAPAGRLAYELPDGQKITNTDMPVLTASCDGKQFAYCTENGIYVCTGNPIRARLLPGTKGAPVHPCFSPDGNWLVYWSRSHGLMMKVAVAGGDPAPLLFVRGPISGVDWYARDAIAYSLYTGSILEVSANGKRPKSILDTDFGVAFPQMLPGGRSVLYSSSSSGKSKDGKILVRSLKSRESKVVCPGYGARFLPSGHLVVRSPDSSIHAIPFDLDKLEATGAPIPILKDEAAGMTSTQFAVSDSGPMVYIPDDSGILSPGKMNLVWVNRDGKETPLETPPDYYLDARISPDGNRLALILKTGSFKTIKVWDFVNRRMTWIASAADARGLLWTADGRHLICQMSSDDANFDIISRPADGMGDAEKLASAPKKAYVLFWAKNDQDRTLAVMDGASREQPPQVSPDGKWVAYWSGESGRSEIYVSPFPDVRSGKWVVSDGGTYPLWSPDGKELHYRYLESIMAVPLETGSGFKPGKPRALLWRPDIPAADGKPGRFFWDISADGRRFLMAKPVQPMHRIHRVANWLELIRDSK
jgi:serine/threonine-protein kinase